MPVHFKRAKTRMSNWNTNKGLVVPPIKAEQRPHCPLHPRNPATITAPFLGCHQCEREYRAFQSLPLAALSAALTEPLVKRLAYMGSERLAEQIINGSLKATQGGTNFVREFLHVNVERLKEYSKNRRQTTRRVSPNFAG